MRQSYKDPTYPETPEQGFKIELLKGAFRFSCKREVPPILDLSV